MMDLFIGIFASLVVAEIVLWLPAASRSLHQLGERAADNRDKQTRLYRAALRTSGTVTGFFLISLFVVRTAAARGFQPGAFLRLAAMSAVMTVALYASFLIRFEDVSQIDVLTPTAVLIPLQLIALKGVGVRRFFRVQTSEDTRLLILGFLVSTIAMAILKAIFAPGFAMLTRSVLVINFDLQLTLLILLGWTTHFLTAGRRRLAPASSSDILR